MASKCQCVGWFWRMSYTVWFWIQKYHKTCSSQQLLAVTRAPAVLLSWTSLHPPKGLLEQVQPSLLSPSWVSQLVLPTCTWSGRRCPPSLPTHSVRRVSAGMAQDQASQPAFMGRSQENSPRWAVPLGSLNCRLLIGIFSFLSFISGVIYLFDSIFLVCRMRITVCPTYTAHVESQDD